MHRTLDATTSGSSPDRATYILLLHTMSISSRRAKKIAELEAEHGRINQKLNKLRLDRETALGDLNVQRMRKASGEVDDDNLLVAFLYMLMRDAATPGKIEQIMLTLSNEHDFSSTPPDHPRSLQFTNGWLAEYARDVAGRLQRNVITRHDPLTGFERDIPHQSRK